MKKSYFPATRLPLLLFWLLAATSLLPAQPAEPVLLKDIAPGADSSNAYGFTDVNGTVFFATDPGTGNHTLWRSNGTPAGTVPLKTFKSDAKNFRPDGFTNVGGVLYFSANDGQTGEELWKSDGTPDGTVLVKDLAPGFFTEDGVTYPNRSIPAHLTNVNGTLYFTTRGSTLYKSDGTPVGTVAIKGGIQIWEATTMNGLFYYLERYQPEGRVWLGKSDGTAAGTGTITEVTTDTPSAYGQGASFLEAVDGKLYFDFYYNYSRGESADFHTLELWRSDGTAAGTGFATKLVGGANSNSFLRAHTFVGNRLYFTYFDVDPDNFESYVLYRSNLTTPAEPVYTLGGRPPYYNQRAPYEPYLTNVNGILYLAANLDANGMELWKSDGTTPGTQRVSDLNPGPGGSNPSFLGVANGALYFSANDGTHGMEPFRYTPPTTPLSIRINAGSGQYETADGRVFAADRYFTGGRPSAISEAPLEGTEDDSLYRQGRCGEQFEYKLPTGNGTFVVTLHFRETYWGMNGRPGDANSRRFNVDAEGIRRLSDYSIREAAEGQDAFMRESFVTSVLDGEMNLHFTKGSADLAYVSAIEVVQATQAWRLNAGGPAYTADGQAFEADAYVTGGTPTTPVTGQVDNSAHDVLYQTGRYGDEFEYNLPTGNGPYNVILHFNETYWGNLVAGGAGSRKFNVDVEGTRKLTEYDIFAKTGGAMRATTEKFRTTVSDGVLTIRFSKGSADFARVSAIEIVPAIYYEARVAAAGTEEAGALRVYPNPVRDRLYVKLATPAAGVSATAVTTAAGQTVLQNAHRVTGERELEIRVDGLKGGLYLLRLQGGQGRQVIRFTKQ